MFNILKCLYILLILNETVLQYFRDLLRIFPRAKFIILPPETIQTNGSVRINPAFNLHDTDYLSQRKDGSITNNLEYIASNGITKDKSSSNPGNLIKILIQIVL